MSNALAVSSVSAAFLRRLLAAANGAVGTAKVRLGAPTAKLAEDAKPVVNLHLYRVEPNPTHSNTHLPHRDSSGRDRGPAQLAMNLHYVVSFYGDHKTFEPDQMLGAVMLALEAEPQLTRKTVKAAIDDADELEDSDLDDALAKLRVTRQLMTIDEFSKIWSIFYQVPYAISLVYEVSHVVIQTEEPARTPLPVAQPRLWLAPKSDLRLDGARGPEGASPVWGGVLEVKGQGLAKPGLTLEVDGVALADAGITQSADRIDVKLEAATFGGAPPRIGIHRLQVVAPAVAGQPAHLRPRSNAVPFSLHPSITLGDVTAPGGGGLADGSIKVTFSPDVASDQSVRLLLDARDVAKPAHIVLPGREPEEGAAAASELEFSFEDLPRGKYLVRADVDGLVSPVSLDAASGEIDGPEATI